MALLNCKECSNQVSTQAKRCPNCGAKAPEEPVTLLQTILSLVAIIVIVALVMYGCSGPKITPAEQAKEDAEDAAERAAHICSDSIKETLNDPDSAKFDYDNTKYTTHTKGNATTWIMEIPTRAKNPFNATISALFQCDVQKIGNDDPKTISVNRIE